jgi:biotin-[acetyl-CoA-carboxylase] ligase BirA-like protein
MKLLTTIELDECGSTNDEAWNYAPGPTLIITNRQTRGRGRQGRHWQAGSDGNIAASLVIPPPPDHLTWIPLAAGVAMIEALTQAAELIPGADLSGLRLKWPNDIMWNDFKMGGILCESRVHGESIAGIVIGVGLNLTHAPELDPRITTLQATSLSKEVLKDQQELSPTLLSALRRFLTHSWAMRTLAWTSSLSQSEKLRDAWAKHAKLSKFPNLVMHDRSGHLVKIHAIDLDITGRLKAKFTEADQNEILFLDQADTI